MLGFSPLTYWPSEDVVGAKIRTPLRRRGTPSLLIALPPVNESCIDPAIRGKCSFRQGAAASATAVIASTLALARPLTTIVSKAV